MRRGDRRQRRREEDENGIKGRPAKSLSARKAGSLDKALAAAVAFLDETLIAVRVDGALVRPGPDAALTPNDLPSEWAEKHGPEVSPDYAEKLIRCWSQDIEHQPIARMRPGPYLGPTRNLRAISGSNAPSPRPTAAS